MKYDLGDQLKDAGYKGYLHFESDGTVSYDWQELIDECNGFCSLNCIRRDGLPVASLIGDSEDMIFEAVCWEGRRAKGDTAEEALAKLFLLLNEKT